MIKTYVILSRLQGSSEKRVNDTYPYEMIIPIRRNDGSFQSPVKLENYTAGWAFKDHLLQGKTILVNPNGGWNYMTQTDQVLDMWRSTSTN